MIGQTVSRYRIIEQLGEGGMGVVYLADDTTLGRRVAIKFLSTTTKEYRARFLREVRAVSALNHPNIATVFDYGETDEGQPYMVMELVTGEPLSEKLREGSLPLPEAIRIISLIAEALGEAHRQGVVHRDVKPSNVIITERGQVKVLDFGLVKQITADQSILDGDPNQKTLPSTRTRSDVIVGTPLYLSPEQATGRSVDGRSDLFALGAVLYECIAGQSAFSGASLIEIGAQVIHVTPPVPSKFNDRIPPELDRITMKAIEKKVDARYQSAAEFIEDLNNVLPNLENDGYRKVRSTESQQRLRTGSASALTTLIEPLRRPGPNLGIFILAILGVGLLVWGVIHFLKPSPYKPTAAAKEWYDKGTDALRNGAFLQATRALAQSIAADSKFPIAHARLAEAWNELDYADKAKDELLAVQSLAPTGSNLAESDARYLEAINATVTRDFPTAVRAYGELAKLNPNDPSVYLDLGRAYEKNEEPQKALESYQEATRREPQYATAFLRAGILKGRQLHQAEASTAFDQAETVYKALGNFEGQAEVAFQRGFLCDKVGKLDEARTQLGRALELARTTANDYQQIKTLQKLGDVEIDAHNLEQARKFMLDALALAQAKGIDNLYKQGLVDVGNTYLTQAKFAEAERYMNQSLDLAIQQKDPRNTARARLALASSAERQAKSDDVINYVDLALPFYEQGAYRKELIQALTLLGRAKVLKGEYDMAQQALDRQLALAKELGDQDQEVTSQLDYGLLLIKRGQHTEALKRIKESYRLATLLGQKRTVAFSLISESNAFWRLGRYDQARAALNEAAPLADQKDSPVGMATNFSLTLGRIALSQRQFAEAIARGEKANTIGGSFKRYSATAKFITGLAQVLSGSPSGQTRCLEAVSDARESGDPLLVAEALIVLAEARLQIGDNAAAQKAASEAADLAARLGSADTQVLACFTLARASRGLNELQKAQDYAKQSEQLLGNLEKAWGHDDYDSFLNRPDIQFSRGQIIQILTQRP
ncbi:MAG TPA: tetratricopeptide repeat protein [Pyrinomonadaceae bacterium]|nr:tetratricopeptide repeat protein [Pyrinomonadaceae bacterium]